MNIAGFKGLIEDGSIKTPCYVADETILDKHIDKMLGLAGDTIDYCYAMKANPFLVKHMDARIGRIEVCSPGELEICKSNAIPGDHIIFSGVNKTAENIKAAMEYGVDVITLESVKHFNLVRDYCKINGATVKVMPRLSSGAQFGMSEEELRTIIAGRADYPFLDIVGIHYFTGTQKKKIEKDIEEMEQVRELIDSLKADYGFECGIFEYGLGLAVPYFEGEDFENVYEGLSTLINYVKSADLPYTVTFELGRFFVYSSMSYLTTVEDIKCASGTNMSLVDGGIHHLNYYGQNMAMRVPKIDVIKMNAEAEAECGEVNAEDPDWRICGSLCTFADVLVRKATLGNLKLGDVLAFHNTGAYSITEAPALFLSRQMPNIYVSTEDGIKAIRQDKESYLINIDYEA